MSFFLLYPADLQRCENAAGISSLAFLVDQDLCLVKAGDTIFKRETVKDEDANTFLRFLTGGKELTTTMSARASKSTGAFKARVSTDHLTAHLHMDDRNHPHIRKWKNAHIFKGKKKYRAKFAYYFFNHPSSSRHVSVFVQASYHFHNTCLSKQILCEMLRLRLPTN